MAVTGHGGCLKGIARQVGWKASRIAVLRVLGTGPRMLIRVR